MFDLKFGFPMMLVVGLIIFAWVMFLSFVLGYKP